MRFSTAVIVCSLAASAPFHSASAVTVTLNGSAAYLYTLLSSEAGSAEETLSPAALPYSFTSSVVVAGSASSASLYDLSNAGFNIAFDHSGFGPYVALSLATISFSVDQDTHYVAVGSYAAESSGTPYLILYALLLDYDAIDPLFESSQESNNTANEGFTLGLTGGDYLNTNLGSLTGTLIAGHDYVFHLVAALNPSDETTTAATASGNVSLSFIPEPSTGLLVTTGLLGLAYHQRRCA